MSTETDELRRLETCAAGSYEIGELVARGGFARCVVRHGRGTSVVIVFPFVVAAVACRATARFRAPRADLHRAPASLPTIRSVRACRRADDRAEPLVVKVTSLGRGADGGGGISVAAARRVAAEVRALLALDGTGGAVPSDDDDDDDDDDDASRALFPRLHDFYLVTGSPSAPSHPVESHLVTTMCAGSRDLRAYIRAARADRRVGLPESQARFYLAELAAALHAVHTRALLAHGDVKPDNVVVDAITGHILLVDYDLAKPLPNDRQTIAKRPPPNDHRQTTIAKRVVVAGTEAYASPELAAGGAPDAASDWWAFAVVAYELCHGRVPFEPGAACVASASTHRACFPPPTSGGPSPGVSEDMKGMIVAMTRRPVAAATDRLGGWSELVSCGVFVGLERARRGGVPIEEGWVTLPGDAWGTTGG